MTTLRRSPWFSPLGLLAWLVTGLAVWLHGCFLFNAGGLWRDEVHLINLAGGNSFHELSRDSFPVLMPLLVRFWQTIGLGGSDLGLRLLGAMIGLAALAGLWLAAGKFRRVPPLPGLALLALNGTVIVFGDSMRAHGLGSLLILLATVAAWWFLEKPSWQRAGVWAVLASLSVNTLFQNAVFVAAMGCGVWAVCRRRRLWKPAWMVLVAGLAAAASLLPYLSTFMALPKAAASLRTGIQPWRILATFDEAVGVPLAQTSWLWGFFALLLIAAMGASLKRQDMTEVILSAKEKSIRRWTTLGVALVAGFGFLWFAAMPLQRWLFFPLIVLIAVLLDCRWWPQRSDARPEAGKPAGIQATEADLPLFAGTTALVSALGFAVFLWYAALPTEPWYYLPLLALAAVCFELGLPVSGHVRAAVAGLCIVTSVLSASLALIEHKTINWRFTNVDIVVARLKTESDPGDYIIVSPWYCGITFQRYFYGVGEWETLPPLTDHSLCRYDLVHEKMARPQAIQPVIDRALATLKGGHRVWLVGMMDIPQPDVPPPPDLPPPPLPFSGWSDRPYTMTWITQINQALRNHSSEFKLVFETVDTDVRFMENLQLFRVEGWQDTSTGDIRAK